MATVNFKVGMDVRVRHFYQCFKLTWLFTGVGMLVYLLFHLLAGTMPRKSYFFYFLENVGMFLMFTTLLMAYSGVYRITTTPGGTDKITRRAINATFKRWHYIFGISLITIIFISAVVLIEVGISSLSRIPYAGSVIMALLTIPLFLINLVSILVAVSIFVLTPPLVGEARSIKDIFTEIKISITQRWVNVILYVGISLAIFVISVYILYIFLKFSVSITRAVQWKINSAYPEMINALSMRTYIADLVSSITPRLDFITEFRKYGSNVGFYSAIIKYIIGLSYMFILSLIISFPLSVYFNISSIFFGRMNDKQKKNAND